MNRSNDRLWRNRGKNGSEPACITDLIRRKKVEFLSKEAISQVLAAEAKANAIRENAAAEARARVEACERECAESETRQLEETRAQLARRRDAVQARAEALILQSREEAEGDIEALREAAREKMREAVKHIEWELTDI